MKAYLLPVLLLVVQILNAQTTSAWMDTLPKIVVTAQYTPQQADDAVYRVKVLGAKTIQALSPFTLSDLLHFELGITQNQKSVFGTAIELQGVSKENVKILIDDVPVIGRLNGIIDLSQLSLIDVDHVEIIEGPVSVFYGTDAIGGVVNLVTKKYKVNTSGGGLGLYYENTGQKNAFANYHFNRNKFRFLAQAGLSKFEGLSTVEGVRSLNWPERSDYFTSLKIGGKLGPTDIGYSGRYTKNALFALGDLPPHGTIKDKDYFTERMDHVLHVSGKMLQGKDFNVTASYLGYQRFHDTYEVDLANGTRQLSTKDHREKNKVQYGYSGLKATLAQNEKDRIIHYLLGTDVHYEYSSGERILNHKQTLGTFDFFGSASFQTLSGIVLQPGLRYSINSGFGAFLSPALHVKWGRGKDRQLRFSYTRGYRTPGIKELYLDFHFSAGPNVYVISGNKDLKPERSHSFNLDYTWRQSIGTKMRLVLTPSVFYNKIDDLIELSALVNNSRHYINLGKLNTAGGRLDVKWMPSGSLSINTGGGVVGRYDKLSEAAGTGEMLFTPEATASIIYNLKRYSIQAAVFYKYTGEQRNYYYDNKTKKIEETIKSDFHNLSVTLSKEFFKGKFLLQIGGKNLFDVKDVEVVNAAGRIHGHNLQLWGRSFFAKAEVKI